MIWKIIIVKTAGIFISIMDWITGNVSGLLRALCLSKGKTEKPDAAACKNFVSAPPREDAFATKEYLSKELLQYLLNLELLPQIEEGTHK